MSIIPGPVGPPGRDGRALPYLEYKACDGCQGEPMECCRIGRILSLCITCEEKLKTRLKLILNFQ